MELHKQLESLKNKIVLVAQEVIDNWDEEEMCGGGVCDIIAQEISGILAENGIDSTDGGQDGDDHAFLIAYNDTEAYIVDIPPGYYETGGGYSWAKIPDAVINESCVYIEKFDRELIENES